MLNPERAFIALISFVTLVTCDITIYYSKDDQEIDKAFNDAPSIFGGTISADGIKVIFRNIILKSHLKLKCTFYLI